jgi:hypothetical protein
LQKFNAIFEVRKKGNLYVSDLFVVCLRILRKQEATLKEQLPSKLRTWVKEAESVALWYVWSPTRGRFGGGIFVGQARCRRAVANRRVVVVLVQPRNCTAMPVNREC